jgi:hypothetical protein
VKPFFGISAKAAFWLKMGKITFSGTKQAGPQCTISKPLHCPINGVHLRAKIQTKVMEYILQ